MWYFHQIGHDEASVKLWEDDTSETVYFGDAEASSCSDLEKETSDSDEELKRTVCKGTVICVRF